LTTTQGPLLPTPLTNPTSNDNSEGVVLSNGSEAKDNPSSASPNINPLLTGLLDSVGVNVNTSNTPATEVTTNGTTNPTTEVPSQSKGNFDSILNDSANLQRLLGVLNPSHTASVQNGLAGSVPTVTATPTVSTGLGSVGGFNPIPQQALGGLMPPPMGIPGLSLPQVDMFGMPTHTSAGLLQPPLYQNAPPPQPNSATMSMLLNAANAKQQQPTAAAAALASGHSEYLYQTQALAPAIDPSGYILSALPPPAHSPMYAGQAPPTSMAAAVAASQRMYSASMYHQLPGKPVGYPQHGSTASYPPTAQFPTYGSFAPSSLAGSVPMPMANGGAVVTSTTGYSTPTKRKNISGGRMLPSPEPSPEGGYIGQHSQGLGGHYQSSYMRKKSRRN